METTLRAAPPPHIECDEDGADYVGSTGDGYGAAVFSDTGCGSASNDGAFDSTSGEGFSNSSSSNGRACASGSTGLNSSSYHRNDALNSSGFDGCAETDGGSS